MRRILLLFSLFIVFSCSEKNLFLLNGHIKGIKNDKVVLASLDRETRKVIGIDTVEVKNGDFTISLPHLAVGNYSLHFLDSDLSLSAILENGKIELQVDSKDATRGYIQKVKLKGAKNQAFVEEFHDMRNQILKQEKYNNCKEIAKQLNQTKGHDEYVRLSEKLKQLAPDLEEEVKEAQLELIQQNIDQYFVIQIFPFLKNVTSLTKIKEIYAQLPAKSQQHPSVLNLMDDIKIKESIQAGKPAPDFTLKTPEGEDLRLSDLRGKYVLIDFWASWCKPCRASFPHMKELYEKYHSKGFEILGVTNDNNHKAWKKAIKDDQIPWLNVADEFPEKYSPAKIISAYGMDYLPSTVLVDKEGIIIEKLLHGEELDQQLKEIFGF